MLIGAQIRPCYLLCKVILLGCPLETLPKSGIRRFPEPLMLLWTVPLFVVEKGEMRMRRSGVLMPVSSLPSRFGIGCFSREAYDFVDFLAASGQALWQILPLGPTGYGDSPYQSFSTFAGSPYYISLDALIEEGLLTEEECLSVDFGNDTGKVAYEKIYNTRFQLLRRAFERADLRADSEYKAFVGENEQWLKDYAMYMAIKDSLKGVSWIEWGEDIRLRKPKAMARYEKEFADDIAFYCYQQYLFSKQWRALKDYANKKGISIEIGRASCRERV